MAKMIVPTERKNLGIALSINKNVVNHDSIEALTKDTDRPVTGTFLNIEYPGQPASISCKYYKGMQYFNKVLEDGKEYTLPLSVARHINERCSHYKHSYLMDDKGNPIKNEASTPRYKFTFGYQQAEARAA